MPKNLGKVLGLLAINVGNFIPLITVMSFSSQLCVQLGLKKLGLVILVATSLAAIFSALLTPELLRRFGAKRVVTLSAFGITYVWMQR